MRTNNGGIHVHIPDIAGQLLAADALTGCDTVAFMWGIRKAKTVKVLLSGCKLLKMGNTDMPMDEVLYFRPPSLL